MLLQKVLVVIVGLVMSVVGALSPEGFFASNEGSAGSSLSANTAEETLTTLRTADGQAFARVSVLWVEVDGRRVGEDAWGTGEVEEIRFKVGVKGVDGTALAVGDKIVELTPTDIITIRMFRGDFSYRGLGTPLATVQLQGTVKTTVLKEGDVGNRVLTRTQDLDLRQGAQPGDESKVAYVVLTTGEKVDTVAVEDGGARLYTEEAATAAEAKDEPGNLLAKWVKIDGRLVREYTWGDGALGKVEFEPAEAASRSVVVAFNGETFEVAAGERLVVEDFVGEYLVYQVSGGMMRLRLDGYARAYATAPALPLPQQGGEGAPLASFDFAPASPKTTDTVQFRDRSTDDGIIVFRQWDFGDNSSGVLQDPTHRFARPGTYEVRLNVTDNDLKSSSMTRTIIVRNSEPVADFDFSPKVVTTDTVVAFSDHSYDSDGRAVNWTWEFGDGSPASHTRNPSHRFVRGGNVTVTLTVTDDLGGRTSLSKVILVRNAPPLAGFTYSPASPSTLEPVQFVDNSTDRDGRVVAWNWSFGDGAYGSGSAPVHAYPRPGLYTVSLTVYDDGGDVDTASTTILVKNRAPFAEFTWTPEGEAASVPIRFTSQSQDPDGIILLSKWNWGDGSSESTGFSATHLFPRAGTYNVTLTVTDNTFGVSHVTRSVTVANSAPRANMIFGPSPAYRGADITFTDASSDPDGDAIVNWTWDLGDGGVLFGRTVTHAFDTLGTYPITLEVRDEKGNTASVSRSLRILNRPPTLSVEYAPRPVFAGDNVTFSAAGIDPDLPGGTLEFEWRFSDGNVSTGSLVTRNFTQRGNHSVTVRAFDSEGGISSPVIIGFFVEYAKPRVNFSWSPLHPLPNTLVNFTDASYSPNGPIRQWRWTFTDNSSQTTTSTLPNPAQVFRANGSYEVRLEVMDVQGLVNFTTRTLIVNLAPHARFTAPTGPLQLATPLSFTDASIDDDGQVMNWTWEFGDGTVSYERHPTHPGYTAPGSYLVRLTATDDRGATNRSSKMLDIANTPPVARWTHDTGGAALDRGVPVAFNGYDLSYDPDGNPLQAYEWSFGDGTSPVAGANQTHTFVRSGRFTVGLTVDDGLRKSDRTLESHKQLRVGANHSVQIVVTASMPDDTPAPIGLPPYAVNVRVGGALLDGTAIQRDGAYVNATIDQPLWVHGDTALVSVSAPFLSATGERSVTLRDDRLVIEVHFQLRLAVTAALTPAPGDRISLLAILGANDNHSGDPLYTDMTERPHGTGVVTYADGTPAGSQRVDIEARWVPLRALSSVRNGTITPDTGNTFPNWCKVGTSLSAENGTFSWAFDGESPCYLNGALGGVYPVGRWEVRARPQVATAENRLSDIRAFYVDPTGGILLQSTMGLA